MRNTKKGNKCFTQTRFVPKYKDRILDNEKKVEKIENVEIRKLCQKVYKKLLEFEKDKEQAHGAVVMAYSANNKPKTTLNSLYDYLCDSKTSKTRNDIFEYILEMDTEFQERTKANILKNAEKLNL